MLCFRRGTCLRIQLQRGGIVETKTTDSWVGPQLPDGFLHKISHEISKNVQGLAGYLAVRYRRTPSWRVRFPLLHALQREMNSSYHRIGVLSRTQIYRRGVQIGLDYHHDSGGDLIRCREIHAYIQDTQLLSQFVPWLTVVDYALFQEGWRMGSLWASHNSCSGACERVSSHNPLHDLVGNSMQP